MIYLCILPKESNKTANLLQNKLTSLHLHMHADRHTLNELGFIGIVFSPPGFLLPSIQSTETRWEMGCSLDWAIFLVIKVRERKLYSHSGEQLSTHPSVNTDRYIHMCAFFPSNKSDQSLDQKIFSIKLFFTSF